MGMTLSDFSVQFDAVVPSELTGVKMSGFSKDSQRTGVPATERVTSGCVSLV